MTNVIEIRGLCHSFGARPIHRHLDLDVRRGRIVGLLGKNGVGKTTLMNILMGFLRPQAGQCTIFGEPSHGLSPDAKERIGLLFEGHLAYDFMTITEIERFYSRFYRNWNAAHFFDLMARLGLPGKHRIRHMSEGQRSQVVLGLLFAQEPDLLLLDDYAMGLDAGYRRLFVDYLTDYVREGNRTVFMTSHVIEDMDRIADDLVLLRAGGDVRHTTLKAFRDSFHCYSLPCIQQPPVPDGVIVNAERTTGGRCEIFTFASEQDLAAALHVQGIPLDGLRREPMTLENAFFGYTGRY